jgi:hypothetical protein
MSSTYCLAASLSHRALLVNQCGSELREPGWVRPLAILCVYPVDKIVQGMWKNFLSLPVIF